MQYSLSNKKLDSAKWFIDAIRQRQETLLLP
jgi:DNA-directed RNA polymerase specialized sigma54-like protein